MEYHKLMMFEHSIIAAVCGIDLAEFGMKSDDSQSLIGESTAPRLQYSKSRGVNSKLAYLEQHLNKILRKVTLKYKLKFVGMEPEDDDKKGKVDNNLIKTKMTINEIRERDGEDYIDAEWANVVLDPQAVQIYLAGKQAEAQKEMQQQQQDQQNQFGDFGQNKEEAEGQNDMQKSLIGFHDYTMRKLQKGNVKVTIE